MSAMESFQGKEDDRLFCSLVFDSKAITVQEKRFCQMYSYTILTFKIREGRNEIRFDFLMVEKIECLL